jgi:hypothetical protein
VTIIDALAKEIKNWIWNEDCYYYLDPDGLFTERQRQFIDEMIARSAAQAAFEMHEHFEREVLPPLRGSLQHSKRSPNLPEERSFNRESNLKTSEPPKRSRYFNLF